MTATHRLAIRATVVAVTAVYCLFAGCPLLANEPVSAGSTTVDDVIVALTDDSREVAQLAIDAGDAMPPRGGHIQGIQLRRDANGPRHWVFLSYDSGTKGYLFVAQFPGDLAGGGRLVDAHVFPSDGATPPLRHAGGFQLAGDVLAVGLEDNQRRTRSEVQFWSVADPRNPTQLPHLTIRRAGPPEEKTAGAVGLIERADGHLVAVANWDSRSIDFYTTGGKPLSNSQCRFELRKRWSAAAADKADWKPGARVGEYQAINLVVDAGGKTYLCGFATTTLGQDVVDLFAVDLEQPPERALRKLVRRPMKLAAGNHFRYGGGLWIDRGRIVILSSPRNFGRQTRITVER